MTIRRRFYKAVTVTDDLGIALDGKVVKTPMKHPLRLPNRALAEAVAAEWEAQGEKLDEMAMLKTKLANTAIDVASLDRTRAEEEIVSYANSDLVCYRADGPEVLVLRQCAHWDPVIAWANTAWNASFQTRIGVVHRNQTWETLDAVEAAVARLDAFQLPAVNTITASTGSALIAMMIAAGVMSPESGWRAAHVDEDYQREHWGEDEAARLVGLVNREFYDKACDFLALVSQPVH